MHMLGEQGLKSMHPADRGSVPDIPRQDGRGGGRGELSALAMHPAAKMCTQSAPLVWITARINDFLKR